MIFDVPLSIEELLTPKNGLMLLTTACLGGLVGLVRQWRGKENTTAGMRTFAIWAILGYVAIQMERLGLSGFLLGMLATVGIAVAVFLFQAGKIRINKEDYHVHANFGLTSAASAMLIFCVGVFMGLGVQQYAVMLAILLALVLGSRAWTDRWSSSLTQIDIRAGIQFACLTGIILPLVPNEIIWGLFNPYKTWLMVVLISGVNFAGYIAVRCLGSNTGTSLTGFIGGLASSTAVSLSFSRRSSDAPEKSKIFAAGVLLSQLSMALRLVLLLLLLCPALLVKMWVFWLVFSLSVIIISGVLIIKDRNEDATGSVPEIKNPLGLGTALKFGFFYAIILFFIQKTGSSVEGDFLLVAFVSGLPDTAAFLMSSANQVVDNALSLDLAALGIMICILSNTVVKILITSIIGRGKFRLYSLIGFLLMIFVLLILIFNS